MIKNNNTYIAVSILCCVYIFLTILCINNCYFWDVIQLVSNEAHWFYNTGFTSLLIPYGNEYNIVATGYHFPLIGIITAALWKMVGYELYVSHLFTLLWAFLLIYNSWKLVSRLFLKKDVNWVLLILLLNPIIVTQIAISSPDVILITSMVIALRAIFENKPVMLAVSLFFICGTSMRGVFVGCLLFASHLFYDYSKHENKSVLTSFRNIILPYLPILLLLLIYYTYYLIMQGWFFSEDSPFAEIGKQPTSVQGIFKQLLAYGLRSVETGQIFIWGFAIYFIFRFIKMSKNQRRTFWSKETGEINMLCVYFFLLFGMYLILSCISRMALGTRYLMPQFFVLTLLVLHFSVKSFKATSLKIIFPVILILMQTGHFWIYPEKIAKSWDCTLAHLPYYELREKCFHYMKEENIDCEDVSAGFSICGNISRIELNKLNKRIYSDGYMDKCNYFIYSNISNLTDETIDELKNSDKWLPIQSFSKWPVFMTIYKKNEAYN